MLKSPMLHITHLITFTVEHEIFLEFDFVDKYTRRDNEIVVSPPPLWNRRRFPASCRTERLLPDNTVKPFWPRKCFSGSPNT